MFYKPWLSLAAILLAFLSIFLKYAWLIFSSVVENECHKNTVSVVSSIQISFNWTWSKGCVEFARRDSSWTGIIWSLHFSIFHTSFKTVVLFEEDTAPFKLPMNHWTPSGSLQNPPTNENTFRIQKKWLKKRTSCKIWPRGKIPVQFDPMENLLWNFTMCENSCVIWPRGKLPV